MIRTVADCGVARQGNCLGMAFSTLEIVTLAKRRVVVHVRSMFAGGQDLRNRGYIAGATMATRTVSRHGDTPLR